jgi:hypothetical protein
LFSHAENVQDSLLECRARFMILVALAGWKRESESGKNPVDRFSVSATTLGMTAGYSKKHTERVLQGLCGEKDGFEAVMICDMKGRNEHQAGIYRFADDRFLRVAGAVRTARSAVRAGLGKRVLGLGFKRPVGTAQNARDVMLACAEACALEGKQMQAAEILMAMGRPFAGEPEDGSAPYTPKAGGDILSLAECRSAGDILSLAGDLLGTFSNAAGDISKKRTSFLSEIPESAPAGRAHAHDTQVVIYAREAGAVPRLLSFLEGAAHTRHADGRLGISVGAFVKSKIETERGYLQTLGRVATRLGCSGVVLGPRAGEPPADPSTGGGQTKPTLSPQGGDPSRSPDQTQTALSPQSGDPSRSGDQTQNGDAA